MPEASRQRKNVNLWLCITLLASMTWAVYGQDQPVRRDNLRVKGILTEDSSIYSQPNINSAESGKAKQFSIVFLFSAEASGSLTRDGFYRVGKEADQATGWIPANALREWDHRLSLHFTPMVGRPPALIYGSEADIEAAMRANVPDRDAAVAEEPGNIGEQRYSMLLPVVDERTITSGGEVQKAFKVGYLAGGNGQAPVISQQTSRVGSPSGGPPPGGGEVAVLELMFVLDATQSMEPYIKGARRVIESISKSVRSMREAGTRIGLLCYRDYVQNARGMEFVTRKYSELTRDHRSVIQALNNDVHEAGISSEDYPEAVFDGLYAGITESAWEKDLSSLRVVVLVGDASGHPSGMTGKNPMNYSLDQLMQVAADNRVRIVAIKITSESSEDDVVHRRQLQRLSQGLGAENRGSFHEVGISENMSEEYVSRLTANIETEIARMGRLVQAVHQPEVVDTFQPSEKAIILNNLKTSPTAPPDEITFSEGWISERNADGKPQVTPHVFMSFDDLALNIFYLQTALTLAKSPTDGIQRSVAETIHAQTGESWEEGESLSDHYRKKLGLPAQSNLLRFTVRELTSWGEQRRRDLADAIGRKVDLMEIHRDDPENWYKLGRRDFRYTFVPLTYLP